jgi:hypothetical protein
MFWHGAAGLRKRKKTKGVRVTLSYLSRFPYVELAKDATPEDAAYVQEWLRSRRFDMAGEEQPDEDTHSFGELAEGPSTLIEVRRLTWELESLTAERTGVAAAQERHERYAETSLPLVQRLKEIAEQRAKVTERLVELAVWLRQ